MPIDFDPKKPSTSNTPRQYPPKKIKKSLFERICPEDCQLIMAEPFLIHEKSCKDLCTLKWGIIGALSSPIQKHLIRTCILDCKKEKNFTAWYKKPSKKPVEKS